MGTPFVETPENTFDYQDDFLEVIDNHSPGSLHMSNDVQEATILGWVRANKVRSCIRWHVGFASADPGSPFRLRRENPQYHPDEPQLRAYDVSVTQAVPQANVDLENFQPKRESDFVTGFFTGNYKWALVTVRYRNFMYRFREDEEIPDSTVEYLRNCWVQSEPHVEALTVTGGQSMLKFAETGPNGPAIGTPFPAPIAMLLSKKRLTIQWYGVPWEYLSDDADIFTPTKFDRIIGKVNADEFMGRYEPGTLLAEPYRYTPSTWAVPPQDANDPLRKVDIFLPMLFFDPPRGGTAPTVRGHNLMPWGGTGKEPNPGGNGKFFLATRDGSTTGATLLESEDYQPVFTHVSSVP